MMQGVRGIRDILPAEVPHWRLLEETARRIFALYACEEIRVPILEATALFTRAVGEATDIVEKEMYTFPDRGGESLSLRPEGTAVVVRSVVEHGLVRMPPCRVWYSGAMFRRERPQKGRYRQFHQIGCEFFGPESYQADVEVMDLILRLFDELGLGQSVRLEINSLGCGECRPPFRESLSAFLEGHREALCEDCRRRLERNPLRVLDCKVDGCRRVALEAPKMIEHLCPACESHFQGVERLLGAMGRSFRRNALMVRGLDYYTRTTFEVTTELLGSQNAVAAGGRYDGLVGALGGPATPAVGFALGMERVILLLEGRQVPAVTPQVHLITLGAAAEEAGMALAGELRQAGLRVDGGLMAGSLKSQMKRAGRGGAPWTVIIGEDEVVSGRVVLRRMDEGTQETLGTTDAVSRLRQWAGTAI
ncbi:MAG: histidine--tRNA ligase [Magnetococcales bacterium]|nr:histidine--tRNA ligase [Magnetococcales bacterium]